jgi:hypothetical protein
MFRWIALAILVAAPRFSSIGPMAANRFIPLWIAIALIAVRFVVVPRDEAHLIGAFGDRYTRYRSRTGARSFRRCPARPCVRAAPTESPVQALLPRGRQQGSSWTLVAAGPGREPCARDPSRRTLHA